MARYFEIGSEEFLDGVAAARENREPDYDYGSRKIREMVDKFRERPSRMTMTLSGTASRTAEGNGGKLFPRPVSEKITDKYGERQKGTRADAAILSNLRTAIRNGQVSLEEVRTVLEKMFGSRYRHAWDDTAGPILKAAGQN